MPIINTDDFTILDHEPDQGSWVIPGAEDKAVSYDLSAEFDRMPEWAKTFGAFVAMSALARYPDGFPPGWNKFELTYFEKEPDPPEAALE